MENYMTGGTVRLRVKEILDARGISIVDAAKMTGLTYTTVAGLYKNIYVRVGNDTIAALCDGLGIEPGDIFEYSPEKSE